MSHAAPDADAPRVVRDPTPAARTRAGFARRDLALPLLIGAALAVYVLSNPLRVNLYNQFVWQADAFLHGRFAIEWPVLSDVPGLRNDHFREVLPAPGRPGFGLLPYPPLPSILLLPLVAIFGLATDAALVAAVAGAVNVGLAWRVARRLTDRLAVALLATVFYGFGTVAWYAAMLGSTWFLAHVVASTFLLLGIAAAIDADVARRRADLIDRRQFVVGLVFALACLARLTTILGAPFFAFVGGGRSVPGRALSAGLGAAIPVAFLFAYNLASTGELFHPAYEYAYRNEHVPVPEFFHPDWAAEDPRYVPQNARVMLAWPPIYRPECGSLLDPACPILSPDPLAMSLLLTSPGYLLIAGIALRRRSAKQRTALGPPDGPTLGAAEPLDLERRLVLGAAAAVVAIAFANLAHFSQGWVQFGYRFSNDFAPFALVLVTLGIARLGVGWVSVGLVALSVLVNAWGVYWGVVLRW
jgi:hypothetical protein